MNGWLIENWGTIVDIFVWGITILMAAVLIYLIYKVIRMKFKPIDVIGLVLAIGWMLFILLYGFDHIRLLLQGIIYQDASVL